MVLPVNALVFVESRTTPGINKPGSLFKKTNKKRLTQRAHAAGGVGHVTAVSDGSEGRTYAIKYILRGSEAAVAERFVRLHCFEEAPRRSRGHHEQPAEAPKQRPAPATQRATKPAVATEAARKTPHHTKPPALAQTSPDEDCVEAKPLVKPVSKKAHVDSVENDGENDGEESRFEAFARLLAHEMRGRDRLSMLELTAAVQHQFPVEADVRRFLARLDSVNRVMTTVDSVWAV